MANHVRSGVELAPKIVLEGAGNGPGEASPKAESDKNPHLPSDSGAIPMLAKIK